jgi:hypothetical protein
MPKQIPKPGYVTERPLYPAVSDLRQASGEQDTLVNLSEVAIRLFEQTMGGTGDPVAFVNAMCARTKVNTSLGVAWDGVRLNGYRFSIVQVMVVVDTFLRRLAREYRLYSGLSADNWRTQARGEQLDPLAALTENLSDGAKRRARGCPEYGLIQYYRAVRNRTIHQTRQDTDAQLAHLLARHEKHFNECYSAVPRPFAEITYDDFLLLTRAVKYYSNVLNDVCDLKPDGIVTLHTSRTSSFPDNKEIVGPQQKNVPWVGSIRKRKGKPQRIDGIVARLTSIYELPEQDYEQVRYLLEEFLRSDPPKRVRRKGRARPPQS